ncbi:MAG: sugar O-acyltransferase (sialic acid O-acetyltransferase NeuD family) [Vicingaceae bacterium]|jgi:sugar O-acyltransferase (sialic acid O-acetyltransferase NeuD family)
MKKALIFGASGHANVIASILYNKQMEIFFIDIAPTKGDVINEDDFFNDINSYKNENIYIGIGSNKIRTRIYERLISSGITPSNCIAEDSFIAHDAQLGIGIVICPGSVIGSKAIIGNNTVVNTLSSIDHDCILGNNSQVTAGVTFGGNVSTGENCFFGVKSAVIPNIRIGHNSIIMAGSVIYKNIPDNVMVGGNPARLMKKMEI